MKTKQLVLFLFSLSICFSNALVAKTLQPHELFSDPEIKNFTISPDGKYLAYVVPQGVTDAVIIQELATRKETYSFVMGKSIFVGKMIWANNERLLLQQARRGAYEETLFFTGKLQALNFDGSKNTQLYGYQSDLSGGSMRQISWGYFYIQSRLLSDKKNILIVGYENENATRRLELLNIYTGRIRNVTYSKTRQATFVTDKKGLPVAQQGYLADDTLEILYRNSERKWQKLPPSNQYSIIGKYKDDSILLYQTDEKSDKTAIVKLNRMTGKMSTLLTFTGTEITYIIRDTDDNIIGYTMNDGKPETIYFDKNLAQAKLYKNISALLPDKFVSISKFSDKHSKLIVSAHADNEPGLYYLYDRSTNKFRPLTKDLRQINRADFSSMRPIQFKARDGLLINGYFTMPKDYSAPYPMVVMVHGGPFGVRDYWGFDSQVQLLASQGYAVLQVNFRGSGGYGERFKLSGHKQFGQAMQDDLTDATLWVLNQKIVDKERVCIYGVSYGGYAALMGVIKEPDLYQCAIGYAGVYDLPLEFDVGDIQHRKEGYAFLEKTRGTNMEILKKYSPARHVDKIKASLLLIHGKKDTRVPFEHFEHLTKALDKINYPYQSLVEEREVHGFQNTENKIKVYNTILKFLEKEIGQDRTKVNSQLKPL